MQLIGCQCGKYISIRGVSSFFNTRYISGFSPKGVTEVLMGSIFSFMWLNNVATRISNTALISFTGENPVNSHFVVAQ